MAHKEGKEHHKAVEAHTAKKKAQELTDAQSQHARAVRDENDGVTRRKSLQKSCDRQAKEAWQHLDDMNQDT